MFDLKLKQKKKIQITSIEIQILCEETSEGYLVIIVVGGPNEAKFLHLKKIEY